MPLAKAVESLGRGDFVDEVPVYVKEGAAALQIFDDVAAPDFFEQRFRHFPSLLRERANARDRRRVPMRTGKLPMPA